MDRLKQNLLDLTYKFKAKLGFRFPKRDLYFNGLMGGDAFVSYGPRVHVKDDFQWFPEVDWNGYGTILESKPRSKEGIPFGSDMVSSDALESWVGRTIRIRFTSDAGKYGWNALWLYGVNEDGVNHEIDLIEHYGNRGEPKAETNLHWGNYDDNHNQIGPVPISCGDSRTLDGTVSLDWSDPDKILILFNGTVVRKIVRKDIIETFKTSEMRIMINAGMKEGAVYASRSTMTVHSILV